MESAKTGIAGIERKQKAAIRKKQINPAETVNDLPFFTSFILPFVNPCWEICCCPQIRTFRSASNAKALQTEPMCPPCRAVVLFISFQSQEQSRLHKVIVAGQHLIESVKSDSVNIQMYIMVLIQLINILCSQPQMQTAGQLLYNCCYYYKAISMSFQTLVTFHLPHSPIGVAAVK